MGTATLGMKVICCNSIIAVYCDYYNAPGECSWHYEPCGTVTAKTCKDQVIGQKFSSLLEGKADIFEEAGKCCYL